MNQTLRQPAEASAAQTPEGEAGNLPASPSTSALARATTCPVLQQMRFRSFSAAAAGGAARLADEAGTGGAHAHTAGRAERCVDRRHARREGQLGPWRGWRGLLLGSLTGAVAAVGLLLGCRLGLSGRLRARRALRGLGGR